MNQAPKDWTAALQRISDLTLTVQNQADQITWLQRELDRVRTTPARRAPRVGLPVRDPYDGL